MHSLREEDVHWYITWMDGSIHPYCINSFTGGQNSSHQHWTLMVSSALCSRWSCAWQLCFERNTKPMSGLVTIQDVEPAGCEQMWESVTKPPHFCLQEVALTSVSPAWCSRSGSTPSTKLRRVSVKYDQDTEVWSLVTWLSLITHQTTGCSCSVHYAGGMRMLPCRRNKDVTLQEEYVTFRFCCSPASCDTRPGVIQVVILIRDTNWSNFRTCRQSQGTVKTSQSQICWRFRLTKSGSNAQVKQCQVRLRGEARFLRWVKDFVH